MAKNLLPFFATQFFTDAGVPAAAPCVLYTYQSGTTTPLATWSDVGGASLNANPIVLDAAGRCVIFGGVSAYTFVLRTDTIANGGTVIKTWDGVSAIPIVTSGDFVPVAGGVSMTDLFELSGPATSSLNPVTKAQMDAADTATVATVATQVAAATAAADAATAAAAAIGANGPFSLYVGTGSASSRTVTLAAGTWQVALRSAANYAPGAEANHDFTVTQAATVGTTTVNTSIHFYRAGGSGYGRITHGVNLAVGSLIVAAEASFSMAIAAASLGSATSDGTSLHLERTA